MPTNRRQGLGLWPKNNMKRFGEKMDFSRLEAENSSENVVDRRGADPGRDQYNRRKQSIQNDPSFMPHEKESELSRLDTMNFYPEDNAAVPRSQMGVDAGLDDVGMDVSPIMDYTGRDPLEDHTDEAEREAHAYTPSVMDKFDIAPVPTTPETEESEGYDMAYADGGVVEDEELEEDYSDDYGFDYGTSDNYSTPDAGVIQFDDGSDYAVPEPEYADVPEEDYASAIPPEVSEAFNYGRSAHGLTPRGVVDDPMAGGVEPDPQGYFGATDAAPTATVQQLERQIDPSGVMDEGVRKQLAVQEAAAQGGPEAAWGVIQHYNQKANAFAAIATAAAEGNQQKPANLQQAAEAATKALANVVDGTSTVFRVAGDRVVAHISNNSGIVPNTPEPDAGLPQLPGGIRPPHEMLRDTVVLPIQSFVSWLKGGGASPDAVIEAGGTKAALEAAATQAPSAAGAQLDLAQKMPGQPPQPAQPPAQPPLQSGASMAQVPHVSKPAPRPRPSGPALAENDPRFSTEGGRSIYTDASGKRYNLRPIPGADPEVMLAMAKARPWVSQGDQLAQEEAAYLQGNRKQLNDLESKERVADQATQRAYGTQQLRNQGGVDREDTRGQYRIADRNLQNATRLEAARIRNEAENARAGQRVASEEARAYRRAMADVMREYIRSGENNPARLAQLQAQRLGPNFQPMTPEQAMQMLRAENAEEGGDQQAAPQRTAPRSTATTGVGEPPKDGRKYQTGTTKSGQKVWRVIQ